MRDLDRRIVAIAVPAFAALVTEPLMLAADTIVVGHLGTVPLAGLAVASTVLGTVVGLCIFLAYGTTATVARLQGAGDVAGARREGVSGVWLAIGLGTVLGGLLAVLARPLTTALSSSDAVAAAAFDYLVVSAAGVPAMLVVLAATGALRGTMDLRTPLVVAVVANLGNVVLNVVLVYGLDLGITGAALGTVIAQWGAALWLGGVVLRDALRTGASVRPHGAGVLRAGLDGVPLLVRTATLRASLVLATAIAATLGDSALAAHQIATTIVTLLAFVLDSLAIAGQTLTGTSLGEGDADGTRSVVARLMAWGAGAGVVAAVLLAVTAVLLPPLFTPDAAVQDALLPVLVVVAVIQPLSGVVFVLDGILIGAGDGRYLAWAGLVVLAVYAPLALVLGRTGLVGLWCAYGGFIAARLAVLHLRQRGDRWMVLGAR